MTRSREVQLKRRPVGLPKPDDFQIVEVDVGGPSAGEVLVKNVCMSVDPYMRGRMVDRKSYVPPFQLGATMTGGAIGRVVESKHPEFRAGDHVESNFGWREAFVAKGETLSPLGKLVAPGKQAIPLWLTILVGIAAALLGSLVADWLGVQETTGWFDWIELLIQIVLAAVGVSVVAGSFANRSSACCASSGTMTRPPPRLAACARS